MYNQEWTNTIVGTRYRTKTNKAKYTIQKTKKMGDTNPTNDTGVHLGAGEE